MRRKLMLPLGAVARELASRPEVSEEELRWAREGRDLVRSILEMEGGQELSATNVVEISDDAFGAARSIVSGEGITGAALQAAAEQIDPESFSNIVERLSRLVATPDASVAGEFI